MHVESKQNVVSNRANRWAEASKNTVYAYDYTAVNSAAAPWQHGVVVNTLVSTLDESSCSTPGLVTTWMGDWLWTDKPSWYVTNHLGHLSSGVGKSSTVLSGWR